MRFNELQEKHDLIGEVRGLGLMLGVELVRDRKSKEPANTEAADVLERMKERGLLIGKGGLFGNTLRIKPPMCITKMTPITWSRCSTMTSADGDWSRDHSTGLAFGAYRKLE